MLEGKSENTKIAVKIKAELLPKSEKLISFLSLGHTEQAATFAARVAHSLASCPSGKENLPRARRGSSSGKRRGEPKGFGVSYTPLGPCVRLSRGRQCLNCRAYQRETTCTQPSTARPGLAPCQRQLKESSDRLELIRR